MQTMPSMMQDNIRVLIVDDSAVMRAMLSDQLGAAPGITVAGKARNGREALALMASLHPDVVTLDLQMPGMDGLAVLEEMLRRDPIPAIMVSALTQAGAAVTLDALERGAVDYVAKPENRAGMGAAFTDELISKIRMAAGIDVRRMLAARKRRSALRQTARPPVSEPVDAPSSAVLTDMCVALGISTGGPPALASLLGAIRLPLPPMVIVQHMPPQFTGPLAARLDGVSPLSVHEAATGDVLRPNCALVAPGGKHLELVRRGEHVKVLIRDGETVSGHKPSVDVMMTSAAKAFGAGCLGVIMTGMGHDGVAGCQAIRAAGGFVLGQDEASSDVYGMNKAAYVEGHVNQQFALHDASATISRRILRMACAPTRA
jgi:two-component system, chemotaxis family, protein-glutamate methylesterase/glutaminase